MTKRKKFWLLNSIAMMLACLVCMYYAFPYFQRAKVNVRAVSLSDQPIDYQAFFDENEIENIEMSMDEENNFILFSCIKMIDGSITQEEIGFDCSPDEITTLQYILSYSADTNDLFFSVRAYTPREELIDNMSGVPFLTEDGEIDVGFATEEGPVFLSELNENELIQNCGWFLKALKKVAAVATVVAVTAAVVAVAVVAIPAVVAAATTIGTTIAVGGSVVAGTTAVAALSAGAAAGAAAIATTTFAIAAATATIAACVALVAEVTEEYVELTDSFAQSTEKTIKSNKATGGGIYYPCLRVGKGIKLQVSPFPVNDEVAVAWIKLGGNMYTFFEDDAAGILELAGYVPGSKHTEVKIGQYSHFHPFLDGVEARIAGDGRQVYGPKHNIHSFYGRMKLNETI